MPLRVLPAARAEAARAALSCASPARLLECDAAFERALDRIADDPTSLPLHPEAVGPEVRYAKLAGFPYVVLFRTTDPAETAVLAVLHTAAGPAQYRRAERRG